jgi:hypothetical protein
MKVLLFAQGPGESSHAYAMACYLVQRNHEVVFVLGQTNNSAFYRAALFVDPVIALDVATLRGLVQSERPDAVLLCNSKCFREESEFVEKRPWSVPTFSIDANWLFEESGPSRCLQWLDRYFVALPPEIFQLGLREHGGQFSVPMSMLERVRPVGFLPSHPKLDPSVRQRVRHHIGVQDYEKLIFCYVSGYRTKFLHNFVLDHVFEITSRLRDESYMIKVCVLGNVQLIQQQFPCAVADWMIFREMTIDDYHLHLASADLVFLHQGQATLAQAISAQIPVVAHVEQPGKFGPQWVTPGEMPPFEKAGLCKLFSDESSLEDIECGVRDLLYNKQDIEKMQLAQQKHFMSGEPHIYSQLLKHLASDQQNALSGIS